MMPDLRQVLLWAIYINVVLLPINYAYDSGEVPMLLNVASIALCWYGRKVVK